MFCHISIIFVYLLLHILSIRTHIQASSIHMIVAALMLTIFNQFMSLFIVLLCYLSCKGQVSQLVAYVSVTDNFVSSSLVFVKLYKLNTVEG
jgi:hypothetical protein